MGKARDAAEKQLQIYDRYNLDALVDLYEPYAQITRPGRGTMNPEAYKNYFGVFSNALSDFRHELTNVVEEGSKAAFEMVVTATFSSTLETPNGPLLPTGNSIRFPESSFIEVNDGGKIVSDVSYFDVSDLYTQLGVKPAPVSR